MVWAENFSIISLKIGKVGFKLKSLFKLKIQNISLNLGTNFGLCVAIFSLNFVTNWKIVSAFGLESPRRFFDTWQVLKSADCFKSIGWNIYNTIDTDICHNYYYGSSLIRFLRILNFGVHINLVVGIVFLFFLAISISGYFQTNSRSDLLIFLLVISSPAVSLLAERGNFDILIFALFTLALTLISNGIPKFGFIILCVASLFKFYTLPLTILISLLPEFRRIRAFTIPLVFLTTIVCFTDLQKLRAISIDIPNGTFGLSEPGLYLKRLGFDVSHNLAIIVGAFSIFLLWLTLCFVNRKIYVFESLFKDVSSGEIRLLEFAGAIIFLSCFFIGVNFDFRLIFLVATMCLTIQRLTNNNWVKFFKMVLLSILWLSFESKVLQPIGDFLIMLVAIYYARICLLYIRNEIGYPKESDVL